MPENLSKYYKSQRWEPFNTTSHGVGAVLMLVGSLVLLIRYFPMRPPTLSLGFLVYGLSLVTVFLASSLYHGVKDPRWSSWLKKLDHSAIYLAIAGTYVPFLLLVVQGFERWLLMAVVGILATVGVGLEFYHGDRFRWVSYVLYMGMGWLGISLAPRLWKAMPRWAFGLLLAGGIAYTVGFGFYMARSLPYHHEIWHLWVLAGALLHFAALWILEEVHNRGGV